jgi:hypothetical protein
MKQLITLCAALTLALSTSAFATTHKEAPGMAKTGAAAGVAGCEAQATEKKLAGAAKTSFVKKCETDAGASATASCDAQATEKKLAGAAKTSFVKKCETDAGGGTAAACDAQAAEKKLAGAAKTSFTKKCVADAAAK